MFALFLSLPQPRDKNIVLERLYDTYKSIMKYVCFDILKDEHLAEDAVCDSFLKILKHIENIDGTDEKKTKAFVVTVAKNTARDMLKKQTRIKTVPLEQCYDLSDDKPDIDAYETADIADAIRDLPDIYRDVIVYKYYFDFSDNKAASIIGISPAAFRKRAERARNVLAEIIIKRSDGDVK